MKATFRSDEIAHVWAHKNAPHGKSPGAVSFNGPVIRSYSTAMARHIEHKGSAAIIYNATSYSVSTSKHQGRIRAALPYGVPVFHVHGQQMGADLRFTPQELFTHYVERATAFELLSRAPRIKESTRDKHRAAIAHNLEEAKRVAAFFGLRNKVDEKAIARHASAKARQERKEQREREARQAAYRAEQQNKYNTWLRGEGKWTDFDARMFPVAFRVEGDELVSTLGARVLLRAARVAYRFAMSKRGTDWRENGETCPVGDYRLNAINEHGIIAGCHRIAWAELERLAPVLNEQPVNA